MNNLGSAENKKLRIKRRAQRYRPAWQKFPEFQDWLKPHPNQLKAYCKFCCTSITADVNVIRKHSIGSKHTSIQDQYSRVKKKLKTKPIIKVDSENTLESEPEDMVITYDSDTNTMNSNRIPKEAPEEINRPPCVTQPAPHFRGVVVLNGQITNVDLTDYRDRKYVILFFYPQDFNKICASEILAISERMEELKEINVEVIGCSTDSHLSHSMWLNMSITSGGIPNSVVPLMADPSHAISKKYGVYLPHLGHSLRAQFIIDPKGILRHMSINDALVGRGTDELIRIVKALQMVDETEEPLHANWKPPQKEILVDEEYIVATVPIC